MSTPSSASIEQMLVSATETPESATDFLAGGIGRTLPATWAFDRPVECRAVAHRVTLIPGDGTGPELAEETRRVLDGTGVEFEWDVQHAGTDVMDQNDG